MNRRRWLVFIAICLLLAVVLVIAVMLQPEEAGTELAPPGDQTESTGLEPLPEATPETAAAPPGDQPGDPGQEAQPDPEETSAVLAELARQREQANNLMAMFKEEARFDMDGLLNWVLWVYRRDGLEAAVAAAPVPIADEQAVATVVYTRDANTQPTVDAMRALGIEPKIVGRGYIDVNVPVEALEAVADLQDVVHMRAVVPAWSKRTPQQGASTGPQDALAPHAIDAWHAVGLKGKGVKIGILDSGFADYEAAVNNGHVPTPAGVRCYYINPDTEDSEDPELLFYDTLKKCDWDSDHGPIVTEAAYVIAPEADYYIASASSMPGKREAVEWMIGKGVDVINVSLGFPWDGPGDGTSPWPDSFLETIDHAVANGVVVVVAGGNDAETIFYGQHNPIAGEGWHIFDNTMYQVANTLQEPQRSKLLEGATCNHVTVTNQKSTLSVQLRWDDSWHGAAIDLDLAVFRPLTQTNPPTPNTPYYGLEVFGALKQWGRKGDPGYPDEQRGLRADEYDPDSDIPYESIIWKQVPAGEYCIRVRHVAIWEQRPVVDPGWFQLHVFSDQTLQFHVDHHHIGNPEESASPGMLAVGAVRHDPSLTQQTYDTLSHLSNQDPYSNQGPAMDGRLKPELVAVDQLFSPIRFAQQQNDPNIQTPDGIAFGTSVAAPRVAGLAALLRQAHPNMPPQDVVSHLLANADPRPKPNSAPNNEFGHGLARLPAPPPPPCPGPNGMSMDLACDKQILLQARDQLRGVNTHLLANWQESTFVRDFEFVRVSGNPPRVTELTGIITVTDLGGGASTSTRGGWSPLDPSYPRPVPDDQLAGTIAPALGQLEALVSLDFAYSHLTGPIPPELGQLRNLRVLDLQYNHLTGPIPPELGQLRNLETLKLGYNRLSGSIPPALGNLQKLRDLSLSGPGKGKAPDYYGITGSIPPELGNLRNLTSLDLSGTDLSGPFPPELGNLTQLQFFYLLYADQLTGCIPGNLLDVLLPTTGLPQCNGVFRG